MSSEKVVLDFIEARIATITGAPKPSRHFYDLTKNDDSKNNFIYAVRPGSAQKVSGTIQAITYSQEFAIEIASDYGGKDSSDEALREAVEKIEAFAELLAKAMIVKVSPITLINPPTKNGPDVDASKRSVSRTYTFGITYRVHL